MNIEKIIYNSMSGKTFEEKKIKDVKDKDNVSLTGHLKVMEKTSSKKNHLLLVINDKTGIVTCAIWNSSALYPLIDAEKDSIQNRTVNLKGTISQNGTFLNIELEELNLLIEEEDELPDIDDLVYELEKRINLIYNDFLKKVVVNAYETYKDEIINAPFSEKTAYAYKGGLIHFIVDMCDMTSKVAEGINLSYWNASTLVDEDILLAGAILSNLGKCKALRILPNGVIEKTPVGILEEDSVLSREIAYNAISKTKSEFTENKEDLETISMELLHMVSSVKGNQSWGALSAPRSKNALILSNINNIVYSKGLFESLEKDAESHSFVKAYDNGKTYYIDEKLE